VEQFIDTPVKRYSSGMGLRLGFAVAAHLEPEILVVDEVLAVGDADFQKKCLGKMSEVAGQGRTVLFVSHNMAAVRSLCKIAIQMEKGTLAQIGEVNHIADSYLSNSSFTGNTFEIEETKSFKVLRVTIEHLDGGPIKTFEDVMLSVEITAKVPILDPGLYIGFLTRDGHRIAGLDLKNLGSIKPIQTDETTTIGFNIRQFPFMPGNYFLEIHLKDLYHHKFEFLPNQYKFEVIETPVYGHRELDNWFGTIGLKAGILSD